MKIKIIIFLLISILICGNIASKDTISNKQDNRNRIYLTLLDDKIISTIEMLTTFNDVANRMSREIKDVNKYKKFLMEMTIECSRVRDKINKAKSMNNVERENQIQEIIGSINPVQLQLSTSISRKEDKKNKKLLLQYDKLFKERLIVIHKMIIEEETNILETGKISKKYYTLHWNNFVYSLTTDFINRSEFLSRNNRLFLTKISESIDKKL